MAQHAKRLAPSPALDTAPPHTPASILYPYTSSYTARKSVYLSPIGVHLIKARPNALVKLWMPASKLWTLASRPKVAYDQSLVARSRHQEEQELLDMGKGNLS